MIDWMILMGGGFLLYFGAEWFVAGASALALRLRISEVLVGLTVVAYGTSAPEIIVGIDAAIAGHGEVALGNIVGSNIANLGLILGIAAMLHPAHVEGGLWRRELPVMALAALLIPIMLWDGVVGMGDGLILLILAMGYTAWMVWSARHDLPELKADVAATAEAADTAGAPHPTTIPWAIATTALGLGVLLVGGHLFVEGAVAVARELGMSDRVVGLTIVAIGTSVPELATSAVAALRGHADLAVGNVIGSNIFNVFLCLGSAALAGEVGGTLNSMVLDMIVLIGITAMAIVMMRTERHISRAEGGVLFAVYVAFMVAVVVAG